MWGQIGTLVTMTGTEASSERGLTLSEAARRLGEDVNTVRRWVRTEQCPVLRDGRKVRIPAAWVDDPQGWLARYANG